MKISSTWGWATWADRWDIFENMPKQKAILENDPVLKQRFNFAGYSYTKALKKLDIANSDDKPWDIRWYYSVFTRNGLALFPTKSLVNNIGFDGTGKHGQKEKQMATLEDIEFFLTKQDQINFEYYSLMLHHNEEPVIIKQENFLKKLIKNITPPVLTNTLISINKYFKHR